MHSNHTFIRQRPPPGPPLLHGRDGEGAHRAPPLLAARDPARVRRPPPGGKGPGDADQTPGRCY